MNGLFASYTPAYYLPYHHHNYYYYAPSYSYYPQPYQQQLQPQPQPYYNHSYYYPHTQPSFFASPPHPAPATHNNNNNNNNNLPAQPEYLTVSVRKKPRTEQSPSDHAWHNLASDTKYRSHDLLPTSDLVSVWSRHPDSQFKTRYKELEHKGHVLIHTDDGGGHAAQVPPTRTIGAMKLHTPTIDHEGIVRYTDASTGKAVSVYAQMAKWPGAPRI
jgi:hypothetical protein